jgi:3',5'-cyclic AMP phosphodiesterase CpdA
MRILHLSDFHLRGDGALSFRKVDTAYWLHVAVEHLRSLPWKPDALVLTGDLADSGDERAYVLLRDALSRLDMPIYLLPGNHDRRDRMRAILGPWCASDETFPHRLCQTVEGGPVRLVLLDSIEPGSHSGHCPDAMADWLHRQLQRKPQTPALVFLHHPPFLTGMGAMDEPFDNAQALAAVLQQAPWARLCCGHMHRPIITQWEGCLAMTAPSVSMQIELDLSPDGGDCFRMETPGYLLHHWENWNLNTHVCQIPCQATFSGPHPFVESVNPTED